MYLEVEMKSIITISREYGSGGRTVGRELAKALQYAFYDSEIIDMAAKDSGLSPDFIANTEQNLQSAWLYNLLAGSVCVTSGGVVASGSNMALPLADQVFNAQRKVIIDLAKKGPCVIVGRCADFILKNTKEINLQSLLNVFIYANAEDKVDRAVNEYKVAREEAKRMVPSIDKRRANHYNTFTDNNWGKRSNYDIMINTSTTGIKGAVDIISYMARQE